MTDKPMTRQGADFVATIPYLIGYEPEPGELIVGVQVPGHGANFKQVPHVVDEARPDSVVPPRLVEAYRSVAESIPAGAKVFAFGYGPHGDVLADTFELELRAVDKGPLALAVHVDQRAFRHRRETANDWSAPQPVPPPPADLAVNDGWAPPAANRDEAIERYFPLPTPTFDEVAPDVARTIDTMLPSLRAEVSQRYLEQLAQPGNPDPTKQAWLAHVIGTDQISRDLLLFENWSKPETTEALVAIYRGAPKHLIGPLAVTAGAALYFHSDALIPPRTALVVARAEGAGSGENLARLVDAAMNAGLPPERLNRAGSIARLHQALAAADLNHAASTSPRAASFPSPPLTGPDAAAKAPDSPPRNPLGHRPTAEPER